MMAHRPDLVLDRDGVARTAQREVIQREGLFVERDHLHSQRLQSPADSDAGVNVQSYADIEAAAADAAGTLDRAAQASLHDRLDWYRLTLAHIAPAGRPLILQAHTATTAAWLFLAVERGHATALGSWYTLRFGLPHVGEVDIACLDALAARLRQEGVERITLSPLDEFAHCLALSFDCTGWRTAISDATVNWRVDTAGGWDAYWAARPARLRETVRRKGRGDPFALTVNTAFDAASWADYEAVYAQSWKPHEGSPAFLRALAEQEGAAGTLRLGIARDGGRPVAAQLWLVENGIATIHKLAHVETEKARSPGTLLTAAMFRHVIALDGVMEVDFGTGDDAYKADWMDRRETMWRIDAWNPATPRGRAGWIRQRVASLVHSLRSRYGPHPFR